MVGFILFQYRAVRSTCLFLLAWCILGTNVMLAFAAVLAAAGVAGFIVGLREFLADEGPEEARS